MAEEVLILGATGRVGRAAAQLLDAAGVPLALFGRDRQRLAESAADLHGSPRLITGALEDLRKLLGADPPRVVLNTVGPFASTAATVIDMLPEGTHYLDVSNEYMAFDAVMARDAQAISRSQTLVAGAGFGVVGTEAVLLSVCAGKPTPTHVRVDALPSVALEDGVIGSALAGSIIDSLPVGRLQVRDGTLVPRAFDDTPADLVTPDGDHLHSVNFSSGDLLTAWRGTGAANVVAGSSELPAGAVMKYALAPISTLMRWNRLRRFAVSRLAAVKLSDTPKPRENSWGHARVTWSDGTEIEGWLRVGEAMDFTCAVAADVAQRLLRGEGTPGAHTPCQLFGADLATRAGAELVLGS